MRVLHDGGVWTSDRRLYLDAAGTVVEEGDPASATLLVIEGGTLDMARARELGLVDAAEGKQVAAPPATKQALGPVATKAKKDD